MKLYKINGNLYTWEQAHNLGYTTTPTEEVTFYSASDLDWGAEVTGGFLDKHSSQAFLDWEYWISEYQEWNTPDSLMQWPVYPSGGEDVVLTNGSIISDAVRIVDDTGTAWYIIRKAMELSWVDEEELEENGWEPYVDTDYEFILFNTETGKISGGIERLNETVFAETHHFTVDDGTQVAFVQQSQFPPVVLERFISQQTVASGGGYETGLPYYASKLYLHEIYTNDWEWEDWSVSESATHTVSIVNGTGASATVSDAILRYIDAANAEVVTVKETLTSYKYQAFKYTLSGTDYYWVNDRTHDTWTDDLSAWGYEIVPVYDEITLYCVADSSAKGCQGSITSSYNGIAKSAYLKDLYNSPNIPTTNNRYTIYAIYDPEKRYEEGHYVDNVWTPYSNKTVADMPATTDSPYVGEILLYDFGRTTVWYVSNYPSDGTVTMRSSKTTIIFRRYPLRAGIDYEYIDVLLHCSNNFNAQANFGSDDYWYSYMDADTVATVQAFGVTTETQSSGTSISAYNVRIGGFAFKILKLYSDQGVTEIETDVDNFYMNRKDNTTSGMLYICNKLALSGVCSYKCRIIKYL